MEILIIIGVALITTLMAWAVNQLPPLKKHVSDRKRVVLVIIVFLVSVAVTVAATQINSDGKVSEAGGVKPSTGPSADVVNKAQPPTNGHSGPTFLSHFPPASLGVSFHCEQLTIPNDAYVDLDNCSTSEDGGREYELWQQMYRFFFAGSHAKNNFQDGEIRLVNAGKQSLENCSKGTVVIDGVLDFGNYPERSEGKVVCIKTSEGAWAALEIPFLETPYDVTVDVLYFPRK